MHYVQWHSKLEPWETLTQSRMLKKTLEYGPIGFFVHFLGQYEWCFKQVNAQNTFVNRIQAPLVDSAVRICSLLLTVSPCQKHTWSFFYCWPSRSPSVTSISVVQSWV